MTTMERFLQYTAFDTQSDETSETTPSTEKQKVLGRHLAEELAQLGLENPHLDEKGCVYGWLPATKGREGEPVLALISHMDTAPRIPGGPVQTQCIPYSGGDIILNWKEHILMTPEETPSLEAYVGKTLIVTDGTTLLGADDKAGIAEVFSAMDYLGRHPELPHGRIAVCITPDEEVGRGADAVDLEKLGASFGYTVDGGPLGELECENFNAADAVFQVNGVNIHPGEGKNRMKNACLIAAELIAMVPPAQSPAHTEGREGFYHLCAMSGDESSARLNWIIRDHDREKFQEKKETLRQITASLNEKYGAKTVGLALEDTYYNMKELIMERPELMDRAARAFRAAGVEPKIVPIRGGTDGAKLTFRGLPCPNLSTGGCNFHSVREYIPADSLEKMTEVLIHLITGV